MKKELLFSIVLFVLCVLFSSALADNQTYRYGDLVYRFLDDGTIEIVKYDGSDSAFDNLGTMYFEGLAEQ